MSKQRYEKEIEEILQKYDQGTGRERKSREEQPKNPPIINSSSPRYRKPAPQLGWTMPNWRRLSSGQYIALAFGVAILAIFVRTLLPPLATLMIILAVVLFLVPILLYRSTGTTMGGYSPREEKRWRGQVIDFNTRRDVTADPFAGIKRWFRRR
jgi:Flp pilus assembly protein TadB